jgi:hypothetical protein
LYFITFLSIIFQTALKDKVPLNTDTTASFEIIDCKLTKVLDYLNNKAAEMKKSQRDEETGEDESGML